MNDSNPIGLMAWAMEGAALLHVGFLKGAPLLWAALGGAYSERSGVINIGLEGMMLTGAFAAAAGAYMTGNPFLGVMIGMTGGGLLGLLHAWVSLRWRADQIVSGMGINLFAMGLTGYLLHRIFGAWGNSPEVPRMVWLQSVWGESILGRLLFPLTPLHILLLLLVMFTIYLFYHTPFGLRLRACGEDPAVVQAAGVRTWIYRYTAVIIGGVLAALGGVQLSLGDVSQFSVGMSNGRGFVALAALICSGWSPGRAAIVCFFFGFVEALAERLQPVFPALPSRAMLALPFVLALVVLSLSRQSSLMPKALGRVE